MERHHIENETLTMGIDEAGRGPILGSMVLAVVCLTPNQSAYLAKQGVSDSKHFGSGVKAAAKRRELSTLIYQHAAYVRTLDANVQEIDERVKRKQLNHLERDLATRLIDSAPKVKRIIADGKTLFSPLKERYSQLEAYNKAESIDVAVAAASIVAKDRRDFLFTLIADRYKKHFGNIRGGGYVNSATKDFLSKHVAQHGQLPPETRLSWPNPVSQ